MAGSTASHPSRCSALAYAPARVVGLLAQCVEVAQTDRADEREVLLLRTRPRPQLLRRRLIGGDPRQLQVRPRPGKPRACEQQRLPVAGAAQQRPVLAQSPRQPDHRRSGTGGGLGTRGSRLGGGGSGGVQSETGRSRRPTLSISAKTMPPTTAAKRIERATVISPLRVVGFSRATAAP